MTDLTGMFYILRREHIVANLITRIIDKKRFAVRKYFSIYSLNYSLWCVLRFRAINYCWENLYMKDSGYALHGLQVSV
jgi:hypothetical protein